VRIAGRTIIVTFRTAFIARNPETGKYVERRAEGYLNRGPNTVTWSGEKFRVKFDVQRVAGAQARRPGTNRIDIPTSTPKGGLGVRGSLGKKVAGMACGGGSCNQGTLPLDTVRKHEEAAGHELLHLAGLVDTTDPKDVMFGKTGNPSMKRLYESDLKRVVGPALARREAWLHTERERIRTTRSEGQLKIFDYLVEKGDIDYRRTMILTKPHDP